MPTSNIKIRTFTGTGIKTYLPTVARLRLEVFRDYPYLLDGSIQQETQYLKKFAGCKEAVLVVVFDGSEIVGASTGLPLENEIDAIKKPFIEKKLDISSYFFFGESTLLKKYRGRGIGHHFFDEREAHVLKQKRYRHICFCSLVRPKEKYPIPGDYIPLDDFWKKRGYVQNPEITCTLTWKDLHKTRETPKPLTFWIKSLPLKQR